MTFSGIQVANTAFIYCVMIIYYTKFVVSKIKVFRPASVLCSLPTDEESV